MSGRSSADGDKQGVALEVSRNINAGEPPVASSRVSEIRNAMQEGTYPLVPVEISDAIIAARLSLTMGE